MGKSKVANYEIINHGVDSAQYFQGCGTAFSEYEYCATGVGDNASDAYKDACEGVAMQYNVDRLPKRPRGIRARDKVPAIYQKEDSEMYYYVSIRYNIE